MQALRQNPTPNTPAFQARKIGTAITKINNIKNEIQLYKLDSSDIPFARKMYMNTDLEKLHPNLDSYKDFTNWNLLIKQAVDSVGSEKYTTILAVQNKRPCGIMSIFQKAPKHSILDRIATWPIKPDKKVEHAGKVLMHSLFRHAINKSNNWISLTPAGCKPRYKSCIEFYKKLGFDFVETPYNGLECRMGKSDFARRAAQVENFFDFKEEINAQDVDLRKILTLKFDDTIGEKCKAFLQKLRQN